jgi:WD40 repeat protein
MRHPASLSRLACLTLPAAIAAVLAVLWPAAAGDQAPASLVLATCKGHTDVVYSVAFSPDGKFLGTGSFDNSVRLWDAVTAKELKVYAGPNGHQKQVLTVAFSPDGHLIASGSADNTLKIWDVPSTSPLRILAAADAVNGLALSPDGKKLATAGKDGLVQVWDAADFKKLLDLKGHSGPVTSVAFSANGAVLASSGTDRTVRFWNAVNGQSLGTVGAHTGPGSTVAINPNNVAAYSTGADGTLKFLTIPAPLARPLPPHASDVGALTLSGDGSVVYSGGADKVVNVTQLLTGKPARPPLAGATGAITSVAVNANATLVGAGSADGRFLLWTPADGKVVAERLAHAGPVTGLSVNPQNTQLLTSGGDGLIKVWPLPLAPTRTLAHPDGVLAFAATPDGKRLITGGADKVLRSWDLAKNAVERQFPGHKGGVTAVAVSANGQALVSGGANGMLRLWNQATGKEADNLGAHEKKVTALAISPAGNVLLSASEDGTVKLWQFPAPPPKTLAHPDKVTAAAVSPDGNKLLTAGDDKQAHLWDLAKGIKERAFTGPTLPVTSVAFAPDGKTVAGGSADKSLTLWTLDGKPLYKLVVPAAVQAVAFSPDGKHVTVGLADGSIRVFETAPAKGKENDSKALPGHKGGVIALVYLPKGNQLVSAGPDELVQVIDTATGTARPIKDTGPVTALALSKDGARLATGAGKTVKVWILGDGKQAAAIETPAEVRALAFGPGGKRVLVGGADNQTRVYGPDGRLSEFFGHDAPVRAVLFHPDGKRIISAGDDKTARVWTSALIRQWTQPGPVHQVIFSPKGDQVLAAGDKTIQIYNAADGKQLRAINAHAGPVAGLGLSADGQRLVTAGADSSVQVWSLAPSKPGTKDEGKPLTSIPLDGPAQSVAISPNGQRVAVAAGAKDTLIRVFDLPSGRELLALADHKGTVPALAFATDNRTLISAGADKAARLSDVGVLAVLDAHRGGVVGVQYHSTGTQALSAGKDGTAKVWDLTKAAVVRTFGPLKEAVHAATYNRDFTQVGVAAGKTVHVWNAADAKEALTLPHPDEVTSLAFSVDKTKILTGSADKQTRLWDVATKKELQFFAYADPVRAVALHPNNKDLVSGAGKTVTAEAASVARVIPVSSEPINALIITPNNTHVLTAGADKLVTFWNLANGNKDRTIAGAPGALHAVAVSKNLTMVATGGKDKVLRLYNFADGKEIKSVGAPAEVRGLAFSPNNLSLAGACADRSVVVWNTVYTPGQPVQEVFLKPLQGFAHTEGVTEVAFAADNFTLYSAGLDKSVKVWKVAADAPVKNFPHPNQVYCLAFHPTAPLLASGNFDGKVRFFDLVKGVQVREINAHPKVNETMIYAIAFSPDGKQLVSAGYDNSLKLWDQASGKLIREFKTVPLRVPPQVGARTFGLLRSPHKEGPLVAAWTLVASLDKKSFDRGHEDTVFSLAFSPDGKYLASGSGGLERAIKIWKVEDATLVRDLNNPKLKRAPGAVIQSHPGWVYGVRYTPDGKRLLSAGDAPLNKGYLAMWDAASGKLLYGEELPLGVFYSLAVSPDGAKLALGAGPRGRPQPELNCAYLLKLPEALGK